MKSFRDAWFKFRHGWFWWHVERRLQPDRLWQKAAWLLPRKLALWAYIRVYSASCESPSDEYGHTYHAWENGAGK